MNSNEPFTYYLQQAEQKLSGRNIKNKKKHMKNVTKLALKLQAQYCGGFIGMNTQGTYNVGRNAEKRRLRALKKAGKS